MTAFFSLYLLFGTPHAKQIGCDDTKRQKDASQRAADQIKKHTQKEQPDPLPLFRYAIIHDHSYYQKQAIG